MKHPLWFRLSLFIIIYIPMTIIILFILILSNLWESSSDFFKYTYKEFREEMEGINRLFPKLIKEAICKMKKY